MTGDSAAADSPFVKMLSGLRERIGCEKRIAYIVHGGNLLAVAAMGSDDMLVLRSFMIGASTCGIFYNLLQPHPLFAPASWGIFFICGHSVQIARLLLAKQPVAMTKNEHDIYDEHFLPFGFTPRTFVELLQKSNAKEVEIAPGARLVEEGSLMKYIFLIRDGSVEYIHSHRSDGEEEGEHDDVELTVALDEVRCHKGVWVGSTLSTDVPADNDDGAGKDTWKSSVRAAQVPLEVQSAEGANSSSSTSRRISSAGVRAMRFEVAGFRSVLAENPAAAAAAERLHIDDLEAKLRSSTRGHLSTEHDLRAKIRELVREADHLRSKLKEAEPDLQELEEARRSWGSWWIWIRGRE